MAPPLQWGRSVNAAETCRCHHVCASPPRFNGAAALTLRKHGRRGADRRGGFRFNGAAALTLRKPDWLGEVAHRAACFNGAAALTLRKPGRWRGRRARS